MTEKAGVVYTKTWVVDLILDLAGYRPERDLTNCLAVEPAAGDGAFLVPMVKRLVESSRRHGRSLRDCSGSLLAYELEQESALKAKTAVVSTLTQEGVSSPEANALAEAWINVGDYLRDAASLPSADFVLANPPYIRLEEMPEASASWYRMNYRTMKGRADIYVAFFEAALSQLAEHGVCAFICADRWMLNQYGAELRKFITQRFSVSSVVEMHRADAFLSDVSAYPAITVIHNAPQKRAVVASVTAEAEQAGARALADVLQQITLGEAAALPAGVAAQGVDTWFKGDDPWPCIPPARLALLRDLESRFYPLESEDGGARVGIGVATGADKVFITKDAGLVEGSQLIPLAMAADLSTGSLNWSGHYLVSPWDENGLVRLEDYPRLSEYFEGHKQSLKGRHIAKKNPDSWVRTIDRVSVALTKSPKLYIPDIAESLGPVLDRGETYPHHNLYFVASDTWDLEILGGLLMSDVAQFFVECYGVRMRGGYFRFQAQYLRRIRVPRPQAITPKQATQLRDAFRGRDGEKATSIALEIYGVGPIPQEVRGA